MTDNANTPVTPYDLRENFYALLLAVFYGYTTDKALSYAGVKGQYNRKEHRDIDNKELYDLYTKEKMSYKEIGEQYGLTEEAVSSRIRRNKNKIKSAAAGQ